MLQHIKGGLHGYDFKALKRIAKETALHGEVQLFPEPQDFHFQNGTSDKDGQATAQIILDGFASDMLAYGKFADFITCFQPSMVLKLLEVIESQEKTIDEQRKQLFTRQRKENLG